MQVRFFERRKIERKLEQVQKHSEQDSLTGAQNDKLDQLKADLLYVTHFPKGEKYVSLFKQAETPDAQAKLDADRLRLRQLVSMQLQQAAMIAEADEGQAIAAVAGKAAGNGVAVASQSKETHPAAGTVTGVNGGAVRAADLADDEDDFFLQSSDDESDGNQINQSTRADAKQHANVHHTGRLRVVANDVDADSSDFASSDADVEANEADVDGTDTASPGSSDHHVDDDSDQQQQQQHQQHQQQRQKTAEVGTSGGQHTDTVPANALQAASNNSRLHSKRKHGTVLQPSLQHSRQLILQGAAQQHKHQHTNSSWQHHKQPHANADPPSAPDNGPVTKKQRLVTAEGGASSATQSLHGSSEVHGHNSSNTESGKVTGLHRQQQPAGVVRHEGKEQGALRHMRMSKGDTHSAMSVDMNGNQDDIDGAGDSGVGGSRGASHVVKGMKPDKLGESMRVGKGPAQRPGSRQSKTKKSQRGPQQEKQPLRKRSEGGRKRKPKKH